MTEVAQTFIRHFLNIPIMITSWFIFFFAFDTSFLISSALAIGIYFISNFSIKKLQQRRIMKKHQLTVSEYFHIQKQLKEANVKIRTLNSLYLKVRSISSFKQLFEMTRLAKRIISLVKTNPKKFYHAENFFYAHLDSAVELTSKYTLLVSQPIKNNDMKIALQDTRDTLQAINYKMEEDLKDVLATDIEHLKMELDFAKLSVGKKEQPLYLKGESENDRKTIEYK
ncbi:5-bromo-4-chloroindolyl phosphate hydrolysis family protein [Bacillus sp. Cr_A10]|uniref:5-bromo-4-chloroindolyl phosphate hydrolysis family protein n=1 Tax=Bacillus sp. Cr_A10 TaxID=3033993 RepID=UPI0023DB7558|nr:5-bromo-4-chloroindolyl phosphate hydrolysis family protein [Bacillus sp. Cr_A10]MDF2067009.1 5-bromo-4-chloroindolyl phosphate hydrolysis family protein [Bacillus sp. Cr_A10]